MVLRDALIMVGAGLAIGAPIAFWGVRFAGGLIPESERMSEMPIAFAVIAMVAIAMLAAYLRAPRGSCRSDGGFEA